METTNNARARATLLRSFLGTFGVLACHGLALCALIVICGVVVPRYVSIFADANGDAELPAMTIMFVNLATWLRGYGYLLTLLLLLPDGLVYFGLSRLPWKWNWLATAWAVLWLLVAIGVLFAQIVAMYLPVESLLPLPKGALGT